MGMGGIGIIVGTAVDIEHVEAMWQIAWYYI